MPSIAPSQGRSWPLTDSDGVSITAMGADCDAGRGMYRSRKIANTPAHAMGNIAQLKFLTVNCDAGLGTTYCARVARAPGCTRRKAEGGGGRLDIGAGYPDGTSIGGGGYAGWGMPTAAEAISRKSDWMGGGKKLELFDPCSLVDGC